MKPTFWDNALLWAFTWGAPNTAISAFAFVLTGDVTVFNMWAWPPYFQIASGGWFIVSGIAIWCDFLQLKGLDE